MGKLLDFSNGMNKIDAPDLIDVLSDLDFKDGAPKTIL